MVAAQDGGDFIGGIVGHVLGYGRGKDTFEVGLGQQSLHHRGVGGQHDVVLVHAHGVVAFALEDTYYAQGYLVEADDASDGVGTVGEEVVYDGLSDDTNLGRHLDVGFGEHLALFDRKLAYFQILCAYAADRRGVVVVAGNELAAARHVGADGREKGRLVAQRFIVGQLQGLHFAGIHPHTAPSFASRMYHDHVGAHLGDLLLDALLRTLADGQHGDDGGHTDDDTQHGEEGAQLVVGKGAQGYFE